LFTRYFRIEGTNRQEGTGIGLALTKELVELHKGSIHVESYEGKGSIFTVILPLHQDISENMQPIETKAKIESGEENNEYFNENYEVVESNTGKNEVKPLLLIVEDNIEVRNFIKNELKDQYIIEESGDGNAGLVKAKELIPDLIISDVMMPKLNGLRLSRILKDDERTSHIPIILLTARNEEKNKIEGLEADADDYITKPFSPTYLKFRIQNLIKTRIKLKELFSKGHELNTSIITKNYADEKFMEKTLKIIETNLSDPEFGVEEFVNQIGMSRMNLYRKITGLTGLSAREFIKNIRLKHAARLIAQKQLTIAEIAFSVGFDDASYFTRCFRQHFGVPPTEYLQ
jgi:DNA-binding response OmpR family regulator